MNVQEDIEEEKLCEKEKYASIQTLNQGGRIMINALTMNIWGKEFRLDVEFENEEGEELLLNQIRAFRKFSELKDLPECLEDVKQYCLRKSFRYIKGKEIDDIFTLVYPLKLYIVRSETRREVILLCQYRYDMENGVAIDFVDEELFKIGNRHMIA